MPNISLARYNELLRKEAQLEQNTQTEAVRWVGEKLGHLLAVQLAMKPWAKWTKQEQDTLRHACRSASTAYQLYTNLLPKE